MPETGRRLSPSTNSSPSPVQTQNGGYTSKISGVPCPATPTRYTAPVHIDVGGVIYTSSLETLTRFPESRLAKMFNGSIPIVLDTLKQHYFIDRDGKMFRYILNYMRTAKLLLPENFSEMNQLYEEAKYFDIPGMVREIEIMRRGKNVKKEKMDTSFDNGKTSERDSFCDCIAVSISPDLGERISLSAERYLIEEVFPELNTALLDSRNSGFNMDNRYVIRFPLNGFCKLNSVQVFQRLLNHSFKIEAATGGGVEGQQFCEYLLVRRNCKAI
ncbi:BTB/POZ domain-containing protein kctd15-like [Ruditapes philippinarum]|uniref:BTB/POZ domain-containing protein kctd15-like n=1 Tax=Ruditapes philippinarum TaxID=129788 RepID=UPI00295A813A|nr:BTB/POZ domain-containing protein kctd15-like [Ruditapes philippinarum]XP_060595719.1 BTB/POZ domain-containing protein kctd15-like [Ruditapes philippinarum]